MKRILFILILLFLGLQIFSQITKRLAVQSGGNIQFIFDTFYEYNNGVTYTDWTNLKVYYIDTTSGSQDFLNDKWKLSVKATDPNLYGSLANSLLVNETIELNVWGDDATATYPYLATKWQLDDSDRDVVTDGRQTDLAAPVLTNIYITYHCGKVTGHSLLGKPPDYYNVEIVFTLDTQ